MEPTNKYQPNIKPEIRPDFVSSRQTDDGGSSQAKDLAASEQSAGKNTPDNSSSSDNLSAVKNAEASRQGYWTGGSSKNANSGEQMVSIKGIFRKKGPLAALLTIGLGLPTIIAIFLSPALVIQQFAESITGEFNDQLAAMNLRSTYLLKKKYNSTLTSGCSTVSIRCKYKTIRENSGLAKRLNNAGVTIEGDRSVIPGRIKPKYYVFEGKQIAPKDLLNEAKNNASLRKALQKGYDPLYAAFSDRKSADIRTRLGLKRSSNVESSTDKDKMNENLKETAAGESGIPDDASRLTPIDDEGNPVDDAKATAYEAADGTRYTPNDGRAVNNLIKESIGRGKLAEAAGKAATKATLKGALTSTAFGAGAVDSACTVWTMLRVAGFAAKYYQQRQLIRYGYEFVKFAHKQKYGDATAEEMDFFASKLTSTNSEGKGALDSDGYKFAAYSDVFNPGDFSAETDKLKKGDIKDSDVNKILLQNETSRYINGQLVSTSLMAKIASAITNKNSATVSTADKVCKFTKSWKGQALVIGLAVAGAVVAFFTGGASISVGAIAQGAVGVATAVALALVQPKLIDMAKGEVIQGDENGNETGNAVVSGMGGYNAQTAQGRGLGVATQSTYQAYNQLSTEIAAKYAKEDRESRSPFDPTSKNTFVGSILSSITPYLAKMQTVGSTSLSISSFVSSNLASLGLTKTTSAAGDKYGQCDDPEYTSRKLAADPFCNLRYAIPVSDLNIDPETVLDYMIKHNYVTEDDPTPQGDYADYVAKCFDRQTSIGDEFTDYTNGESEGNGDSGDECIIGKGGSNEERNRRFRLFYIDTSVEDGMEEDFGTTSGATTTGEGAELNIASFNVRGASHDGDGGTIDYKVRMEKTVETIQREGFDLIGFQEFESSQRSEFKKSAISSTYTLSSYDAGEDNGNAIAWNKSKYDLVNQGTQPGLVYTTGGKLKSPWVKLRDKTTGQEFYFLNTHDPANVHDNPVTKNAPRRTENAKAHVEFMNQKAAEGLPVFITGDFNSSFDKRSGDVNVTSSNIKQTLPYCIMTSGGTIQNAFDIYKKRQVKCPNNDISWNNIDPGKGCSTQIDHLYIASAGLPIEVPEFGCVKKGDKAGSVESGNGSDHDTVRFKVVITSGSDGGGGSLSGDYKTPSFKANPAVAVDEPGSRCTGGFTVGAQSLSKLIKSRWPIISTIGGYSCRANTADPGSLSVHAVGRALDIMVDATTPQGLKAGDEIRNFLIGNAEALGVQRVIWNRHIWSANIDGWRNYTGPVPHTDHVHAEINLNASKNAKLGM